MKENKSVRLIQICNFFNLLVNMKSRDITYLNNVFNRSTEGFNETVTFLRDFDLLDIFDNHLRCFTRFNIFLRSYFRNDQNENIAKEFIIDLILENTTKGAHAFHNYLNKFHFKNGEFVYSPLRKENLRFSEIRNLLLELEVVQLSVTKDFYYLDNSYLDRIDESQSFLSQLSFRKLQKLKEILGQKAESWVLKDESRRLSKYPELFRRIKLISDRSVCAGYDILSFEVPLKDLSNPIFRYIEVKAVKNEFPQFFWSRNEIQKAKMFGMQYWLYLVYYDNIEAFNVIRVERISNPYKTIFKDISIWKRQIEKFSFSK